VSVGSRARIDGQSYCRLLAGTMRALPESGVLAAGDLGLNAQARGCVVSVLRDVNAND
jgi:hypothetical protein